MAVNTSPIFISRGNIYPARITGANIASDGTGLNIVAVVTAVTDGTRVDGVRFRNSQLTAAASSNMVHRIFITDISGLATTNRLIGEIATPLATRSLTAIGATSIFTFDQPIIMKAGQIMSVSQSAFAGVQDQFDACAFAGDYTA